MKKIFLATFLLLTGIVVFSQGRVFTKSGKISFFSKAPLEDIEAHNKAAVSVLDINSGQLEFSVLLKGFQFEKALMQEHFNENYLESDKFPKAVFKGKLNEITSVNFTRDGKYKVSVGGMLTMHGETKPITAPGIISIQNGKISSVADFSIVLNEYRIQVPAIVKDKIANSIKIMVSCNYEPMN